jgi:hypothetical protein
MVYRSQIICVNKQPRNDIYSRITHIGIPSLGYSVSKIPIDVAISNIEQSVQQYYVKHPVWGHEVDVIVATSRYGNKYLKTVADGDEPNNLLELNECY